MPNFHPHLVAQVRPLLEPDEEVWAVHATSRRQLAVTPRHVFVLSARGVERIPIDELVTVTRVSDTLVVIQRRAGPTLGIPVRPGDEHGLQALTVLGLLVAERDLDVGDAPPAASTPDGERRERTAVAGGDGGRPVRRRRRAHDDYPGQPHP